ncbi:hypothetical protein [Streptomyces aureus]|uniref:hypothetical protein n=1 Tax=Streptomyces aureus TaxID=193461 RepID=UPI003679E8BD
MAAREGIGHARDEQDTVRPDLPVQCVTLRVAVEMVPVFAFPPHDLFCNHLPLAKPCLTSRKQGIMFD